MKKVKCDGCEIICIPEFTTYEEMRGKQGLHPKRWCSRKCVNKRLDELTGAKRLIASYR